MTNLGVIHLAVENECSYMSFLTIDVENVRIRFTKHHINIDTF